MAFRALLTLPFSDPHLFKNHATNVLSSAFHEEMRDSIASGNSPGRPYARLLHLRPEPNPGTAPLNSADAVHMSADSSTFRKKDLVASSTAFSPNRRYRGRAILDS